MRTRAREVEPLSDVKTYEDSITFAREIADVLRKNIVQAVKVEDGQDNGDQGTWKLRITKDTELGSNDSIKNPAPMTSRRARKQENSTQGTPTCGCS
jgi:hypothetical protein